MSWEVMVEISEAILIEMLLLYNKQYAKTVLCCYFYFFPTTKEIDYQTYNIFQFQMWNNYIILEPMVIFASLHRYVIFISCIIVINW